MSSLCLVVLLSLATLGAALSPTVSIINDVSNKESVNLYCRITKGPEITVNRSIKVGETFKWVVTDVHREYTCTLSWGPMFSGITSFDPKRDANKFSLLWKAKDDGLFLQYDHKGSYTKVADWESE